MHRFAWPTLVVALVLAVVAVPPASAQSAPTGGLEVEPADGLEAELRSESDGPVQLVDHTETGQVRFVGTAPGTPLEEDAGQFTERFGSLFGVEGGGSLEEVATEGRVDGGATTVFQQRVDGLPVVAGELRVQVDAEGQVLSASGELSTVDSAEATAAVSGDNAVTAALTSVAGEFDAAPDDLQASGPERWVFDPALLDGPEAGPAREVWRLEVTGPSAAGEPLRVLVLVDSETGEIALQFNQIAHARDRTVCDDANMSDPNPHASACVPPFAWTEGQAATGITDVDEAYDFLGGTYDFFFDRFGRDSLDDDGLPLVASVRWCPSPTVTCPHANAFWTGSQASFGDGYLSDEVVGHELVHGFTQFTSDLFLYHQSGALNESFSQVFGELIDLTNPAGDDTPGVRWLDGEDLPGGAIRDLQDPPAFGQPDRMTSPLYLDTTTDGGGVHHNAGVGNKAASLMTDGGSFNGQTIAPLGLTRTARIFYEVATTLLTSGSDYADLGAALPQACNNLLGVDGITAAHCTEVSQVVLATEMATVPPNSPAPEAPVCPAGQSAVDLFADDMENPSSGNWLSSASPPSAAWGYAQGFAHSGVRSLQGYVDTANADASVLRSAALALPPNAFLWFAHSYEFDGAFDGGVVEYFFDGGPAWLDAGPLFTHQGYSGTVSGTGNPLAGRPGFVERSRGFTSSRLDLSSLAEESVWFRFRIGTDDVLDLGGWTIDDVRVYTCRAPVRCSGVLATVIIADGDAPTAGPDVVVGTPGPDTINTLGGNDRVCGLAGGDTITSGFGNDTVFAGTGADTVRGGGNNDNLLGGDGRDRLEGGANNDSLNGGTARDTCVGGPQTDTSRSCEVRTGIP